MAGGAAEQRTHSDCSLHLDSERERTGKVQVLERAGEDWSLKELCGLGRCCHSCLDLQRLDGDNALRLRRTRGHHGHLEHRLSDDSARAFNFDVDVMLHCQ